MLKKVRSLWGLALAVLPVLAVSLLAGCGGGGSSTPTGTLKVGLTDAQSDDFANVFVAIREVRVVPAGLENARDDDARLPVVATFTTPKIVDILTLRFVQEALGEVVLPAGRYNQIRLVLAANVGQDPVNYVVLKTGQTVALDTPSGQQSGLKVLGKIDVKAGVINAVLIDFDPNTAIVVNKPKYILKPTGIRIVQTADLQNSFGALTGSVTAMSNWSTATVSVVPQGSASAIAAGNIFSNFSSGAYSAPFSAFVPGGSYKVHVQASGFRPYSSSLQTVTAGNGTAVGTIQLLKQ